MQDVRFQIPYSLFYGDRKSQMVIFVHMVITCQTCIPSSLPVGVRPVVQGRLRCPIPLSRLGLPCAPHLPQQSLGRERSVLSPLLTVHFSVPWVICFCKGGDFFYISNLLHLLHFEFECWIKPPALPLFDLGAAVDLFISLLF